MDDAQKMTDNRFRIIQKRLSTEYRQAAKELLKQTNEYYAKFKKEDLKRSKLVKQGKMSKAEYIKWRESKMLYGEALKQKVDVMSQHMLNVDKQAAGIINREMFGVYANNYNFAKYEVEQGLKINTSFSLFDKSTVERMVEKNPKLLRERKTDDGKILRWSRRKVNTAITQGVLQGEPIDKIAQRLVKVVGMEERYALTNARTAMTAAQNAGRMESYANSKALGIDLKKQWMATLDERTRTSHQELDGETVEIGKKFSNKLMFPGDPDGAPGEVYNCRCTLVGDPTGYPDGKFQRYDNIEGKPIDNVTYKEWIAAKQKAANASNLQDAEKEVDAIKATIKSKGADKVFSGIWKDDVTYADWEDKKDKIQAKRDFYDSEIDKLKNDPNYKPWLKPDVRQAKIDQMQQFLKDLDEFEKYGPEYSQLFAQLKNAEDKVKGFKMADLAGTAYSEERRNAALWATTPSEYRQVDKYFDKLAEKVHGKRTAMEYEGYYHYTWGSGPFNAPLAGFKHGFNTSGIGFDGPGNVDIDEGGYGDKIRGLTDLCAKSKYDKDFWVQSGQYQATMEGFLGIPYNSLAGMSESQLQQFVGVENQIPQFLSAAVNKGGGSYTPGDTLFNIYVPKGSEALYVRSDGHFGKSEHEMILQRGGTYRVTRIYWGTESTTGKKKLIVDLELHPERGYNKFQQ